MADAFEFVPKPLLTVGLAARYAPRNEPISRLFAACRAVGLAEVDPFAVCPSSAVGFPVPLPLFPA
jgi:hypothetical protein